MTNPSHFISTTMADDDYDFDAIDEEEEFEELEDELEEDVVRERGQELLNENRRTLPKMTLYEATAMIGVRAKMLATGAPAHPRAKDAGDHIRVATREFILRVIPLKVRRTHPNGDYEIWKLNEFEILPEILQI